MWVTLLLVANTILMTVGILGYRSNGNARRMKTILKVVLISTAFEYYFRNLQMVVNDTPFEDTIILIFLVQGLLAYGIYYGLLIPFYQRVSKRASEQSIPIVQVVDSSLEDKLSEVNSLKDKGLISDEEYATKRSAILS